MAQGNLVRLLSYPDTVKIISPAPDAKDVPLTGPFVIEVTDMVRVKTNSGWLYTNLGTFLGMSIAGNVSCTQAVHLKIFSSVDATEATKIFDSGPLTATYYNNLHIDTVRGVFQKGWTNSKRYTVKIPEGKLKGGKKYYWMLDFDELTADWVDSTGHADNRVRYPNPLAGPAATATIPFTTVPVGPHIEKFDVDPSSLSEAGGKTTLSWKVVKVKDASGAYIEGNKIIIEPHSIEGLGNEFTDLESSVEVTLDETTRFIFSAINDEGASIAEATVEVKQPPTEVVNWSSPELIPEINLTGARPLVAQEGEEYQVVVYTENIRLANIYLYYPLTTPVGTPGSLGYVDSERISVAGPLSELMDESDNPQQIKIVGPKQRIVDVGTAISGAWGYTAHGEDNVYHHGVGGHFIYFKA